MPARRAAGVCLLLSASLVAASYFMDRGEPVVPWRELRITEANLGPPTPPPPAIPAGVMTCRAPNVRVEATGPMPLNSATTMYGVGLSNIGSEACVVRSPPSAKVVRGVVRIWFQRRDRPFVLTPGERTGADLAVGTCEHSFAGEALLRVGYGTRMSDLRIRACRARAQTLAVSPFQPPLPPEPKLERFPLRADLRVPKQALAGTALHFRVALENTSSKPFRFPYCPVYEAGVTGAARFAAPLNCTPVGELGPGEQAVFDLRTLRGDARPGRYEVYWDLDDGTLSGNIPARDAIELQSG